MKNGRIVTVQLAPSVKSKFERIWQIEPVRRESRRVTLLVLLDPTNSKVQEMRIFQRIGHHPGRFRVRDGDLWLQGGRRLNAVTDFHRALAELNT
jgi:hypothetical protein